MPTGAQSTLPSAVAPFTQEPTCCPTSKGRFEGRPDFGMSVPITDHRSQRRSQIHAFPANDPTNLSQIDSFSGNDPAHPGDIEQSFLSGVVLKPEALAEDR